MSRGLGKLQREIIAAFDDCDREKLAREDYEREKLEAEREGEEEPWWRKPDGSHAGWVDMLAVLRLVATRRGHDLEARAAEIKAKWPRVREHQLERYAVPQSLDRSFRRAVSGLVKAGLLGRFPRSGSYGTKRFYRRTDKCSAPERGNT